MRVGMVADAGAPIDEGSQLARKSLEPLDQLVLGGVVEGIAEPLLELAARFWPVVCEPARSAAESLVRGHGVAVAELGLLLAEIEQPMMGAESRTTPSARPGRDRTRTGSGTTRPPDAPPSPPARSAPSATRTDVPAPSRRRESLREPESEGRRKTDRAAGKSRGRSRIRDLVGPAMEDRDVVAPLPEPLHDEGPRRPRAPDHQCAHGVSLPAAACRRSIHAIRAVIPRLRPGAILTTRGRVGQHAAEPSRRDSRPTGPLAARENR